MKREATIAVVIGFAAAGLIYYFDREPQPPQETIASASSSALSPVFAPSTLGDKPMADQKAIFRWVDENNRAHYGDVPPRGQKFEMLREDDLPSLQMITIKRPEPRPVEIAQSSSQPQPSDQARNESSTASDSAADGGLCGQYTKELAALRARMRRGYGAAESPRLLNEELRLRNLVAQYCH